MEDVDIGRHCSLSEQDAAAQALEWADLRNLSIGLSLIDDGVRLTFSSDLEETIRSLVMREQVCCPMFNFAIYRDHDAVALEVTSEDVHAQTAIASISGVAL